MKFLNVAEFFEKIEQANSRLDMMKHLAEMLGQANEQEIASLIYLSQGKLGPDYKNIEAGMGEQYVLESIAKISGYKKEELQKKYKEQGDLGLVAQEILSKKKQSSLYTEELTVNKVFANFLKIATTSGTGSQESKIKLLAELLNSAQPLEAKFITRVPLGQLRLGTGDPTLMDSLAVNYLNEFQTKEKKLVQELETKYKKPEDLQRQLRMRLREKIEEKYNIFPDLGKIAEMLKQKGLNGLNQIEITVGVPIRPTLAERMNTGEEIIEKLGNCAIEGKYDGLRLQCHKNENTVTIYSRNLEEMTAMFPDIVQGIRTEIKAKTMIFEGEALAVNEITGEFEAFQVTIQRKRKHEVKEFSEKVPLKLFVFDCMYLNGKNLMPLPFQERQEKLNEIITERKIVDLPERIVTSNALEVNSFFDQAIEKGLEGIIAKDLNAPYIAGARKFAWIKLKRSYKGELHDTIDAVIIGYLKGRGQRTVFGLGALLAAVYNPERDVFESIAKIGTGLSEEQLKQFAHDLEKLKTKQKPARVDSVLNPDVWVEPKIVIEVNADEITKSPVHTTAQQEFGTGLALRFPRLVKIRTDKQAEDCTHTDEIIKMYKNQKHVQVIKQEGSEN
ncbi:MAG: ATP-dependent DNA ligase [Candidatus Diapherotrites archaeon]|nr:ATP-dependent DNA ligase [Candidatus Diapherotrites archaeon]